MTRHSSNQVFDSARPTRRAFARAVLGAAAAVSTTLVGCPGARQPGVPEQSGSEVVVYAALDEEFSRPIFDAFTRETGVEVLAKFDTESTKTVGLAQRIIAERDRPRCDVFWNNEVLHTLRLANLGLLRPYKSPRAPEYPDSAQSPDGAWYGFAARARVLIVNTTIVPEARRPDSIMDLVDPQWRDRVGIAKPLFGTTATHAACLFAHWGDQEAKEYYESVKRNARIMSGNRQVAQAVGAGGLAFGVTDTDDAMLEVEGGAPVTIVYPDQGEGEMGTLFIPNTLALVKGGPNPRAAERLVDYLLSPEIEGRLAMGASAQIPLNRNTEAEPRVESPETVRAMDANFAEAAQAWDTAAAFLRDEFTVQ